MNKIDFINKLKEGKNPLDTLPQKPQIDDLTKRVDAIKGLVAQTNKLGLTDVDIDEEFNPAKDYDNSTEFYKDIIDHLMYKRFRYSYFNPVEHPKPRPLEPQETDPQLKLDFQSDKKEVEVVKNETKPISQMSPDEYDEFQHDVSMRGSTDLLYVITRIRNAAEKEYTENNGIGNPLKEPYILLQNLNKSKINEEKFVDSEIFRIIAESETPKISKQEIIDFLKDK
jgi:hypothetical protein